MKNNEAHNPNHQNPGGRRISGHPDDLRFGSAIGSCPCRNQSCGERESGDRSNRCPATGNMAQSKEKWLETNIKIPVFQGLTDTKYQDQLNDIIESHASRIWTNGRKKRRNAQMHKRTAIPCTLIS